MSTEYQSTKGVPLNIIVRRLEKLSDAIINKKIDMCDEFTMRIPAECDRDADLILSEAATRLELFSKENAELKQSNERLKKDIVDLEEAIRVWERSYTELAKELTKAILKTDKHQETIERLKQALREAMEALEQKMEDEK